METNNTHKILLDDLNKNFPANWTQCPTPRRLSVGYASVFAGMGKVMLIVSKSTLGADVVQVNVELRHIPIIVYRSAVHPSADLHAVIRTAAAEAEAYHYRRGGMAECRGLPTWFPRRDAQ